MIRPFLLVLVFALLPLPVLAQERERTLTMTGHARLAFAPDVVHARGAVHVSGESAAEALTQARKRLAALATAMRPFGEVTLTRLSLGQDRKGGKRLIGSDDPGFAARGGISVALSDPGRAGEALDALVAAGADGLVGLRYDIEDRSVPRSLARERAVADALERAETYARAANLALGPILTLTEAGSGPSRTDPAPVGMYDGYSSHSAKMALEAPGDVGIAASVTIRWALE